MAYALVCGFRQLTDSAYVQLEVRVHSRAQLRAAPGDSPFPPSQVHQVHPLLDLGWWLPAASALSTSVSLSLWTSSWAVQHFGSRDVAVRLGASPNVQVDTGQVFGPTGVAHLAFRQALHEQNVHPLRHAVALGLVGVGVDVVGL